MKKIFQTLLFISILVFFTGISFANTFNFGIVDTSNDLNELQSYNIYQRIGEATTYTLVNTVDSSIAEFTLTFSNNNSYTLTATAVDKQGRESAKSAELQIVIDQLGNPTFPDGPTPPTMITIIR